MSTRGIPHRKLTLAALEVAKTASFAFGGGVAFVCSIIEGPLRAASDGLGAGIPPSVIARLVRQGAAERVQAEVDRQRTPVRAQTRDVLGLEDEPTRPNGNRERAEFRGPPPPKRGGRGT